MEGNAYSAILEVMHESAVEAAPAGFRIGAVLSGAPLSIDVGGAVQSEADLVLCSASPSVGVDVDNAGALERHTHTARIGRDKPKFESGDKVLLLPIEEEQRYIVLARLVGI